MEGVVDRIEGNIYVIEVKGITREVDKSIVEPGVKEGSVVRYNGSAWVLRDQETKARADRIHKKMKNLFE